MQVLRPGIPMPAVKPLRDQQLDLVALQFVRRVAELQFGLRVRKDDSPVGVDKNNAGRRRLDQLPETLLGPPMLRDVLEATDQLVRWHVAVASKLGIVPDVDADSVATLDAVLQMNRKPVRPRLLVSPDRLGTVVGMDALHPSVQTAVEFLVRNAEHAGGVAAPGDALRRDIPLVQHIPAGLRRGVVAVLPSQQVQLQLLLFCDVAADHQEFVLARQRRRTRAGQPTERTVPMNATALEIDRLLAVARSSDLIAYPLMIVRRKEVEDESPHHLRGTAS